MADARGPLAAWLAPVTWPMARVYGRVVAWRNARFDRGEGVERLEVRSGERGFVGETCIPPVISVGNLTAGGTGKSPFVAWCAAEVAAIGAKPVIALRGYRAARVATSDQVLSDEAMEYSTTAPMARVVVGARRRAALEAELASPIADSWRRRAVVLLDDGFQHRQLARDLNIMLIDATRPSLDGDLLPNGWLREAASNIARADLVVLTKADDSAQRARAAAMVATVRGRSHDAVCVHDWRALTLISASGERTSIPVTYLNERKVLSACALGNPAHFHGMAARAGAQVVAQFEKSDHRPFTREELERAARQAGVDEVLLSRKDFVKLEAALPIFNARDSRNQTAQHNAVTYIVPELALCFLEGEDRIRTAIARVVSARNSRASE